MKALIFATKLEADFAVSNFKFEKVKDEKFEIYRSNDALLAVSGIGVLSASLCAQYILRKYEISKILNLGACGALNPKWKTGEVFEIGKVVCADSFCDDEFLLCGGKHTLVSSSRPIKTNAERNHYASVADFADMECYGILKTLSVFGFDLKNFSAIKVVSDFSENCEIKKNIPLVAKNLEEGVVCFLK